MSYEDQCPHCKNTNGEHNRDCIRYNHYTMDRYCDLDDDTKWLVQLLNMARMDAKQTEMVLTGMNDLKESGSFPNHQSGKIISFPRTPRQREIQACAVRYQIEHECLRDVLDADPFMHMFKYVHLTENGDDFLIPNGCDKAAIIQYISNFMKAFYASVETSLERNCPEALTVINRKFPKNKD
jgi:hypothetical protein